MKGRYISILKGVSRSFYLSLRLLPESMREAASVAYLLARASDTIADTDGVAGEVRLELLGEFEHFLNHGDGSPKWHGQLLDEVSNDSERSLLEHSYDILKWMRRLPEDQMQLVSDVVTTIISGQRFDLEYFMAASGTSCKPLEDVKALDHYTWSVAGCVGEFWTKLGYTAMGADFSEEPQDQMIAKGIAYGKGLQLINILRDLPKDLHAGRCYLPVDDPGNRVELMKSHQHYVKVASGFVHQGVDYAENLKGRRLQVASVLPAMIGMKTLSMLQDVSWDQLDAGIKIGRPKVYLYVLSAFAGIFHVAPSLEVNHPND